MANLGRLLVAGAERVDLPDFLSIDSYVGGDFKYMLKGLIGGTTPYVLKGFAVDDPRLGAVVSAVPHLPVSRIVDHRRSGDEFGVVCAFGAFVDGELEFIPGEAVGRLAVDNLDIRNR